MRARNASGRRRETARGSLQQRSTWRRPSDWRERILLAALAAVGLVISVYLAAFQVGVVAAPWDPLFGPASSARVLHSALSRALPVPDAALGVVAYAAEIVTGLAGGAERWRTHPWIVLAFGAIAAGLGIVSIGLVVMQVAVVRSGCSLCLCSAAVSLTIASAVVMSTEVRAAIRVVAQSARARGMPWP